LLAIFNGLVCRFWLMVSRREVFVRFS